MSRPASKLALAAALAFASSLAAAATRDDSINSSFNAWTIKGLRAARAEWRPDACLSAALVYSRPGAGDKLDPIAGGELDEFFFYSAENPTADYRFRSPLLPYEAGRITPDEANEEKGPGPIVGARRCISEMPVTLKQALQAARRAGLSFDAHSTTAALRARLQDSDFSNPSRAGFVHLRVAELAARGREIWAVAEIFPDHTLSVVSIDARSGRVLKKVFNAPEL